MSAPTRPAMRLLSPRLRCLSQKAAPIAYQIRHASRYSNPTKRTITSAPAQQSFFVNPAGEPTHTVSDSSALSRNPLDARAVQDEWEEERQHAMRRMRFAGVGLFMSLVGLAATLYNLDLDGMDQALEKEKARKGQQLDASNDANARFQGKEVHVVGAGDGKRITAQGQGEEIELVETGTSSVPHFPKTIYLPTTAPAPSVSNEVAPGSLQAAQPNTAENPGNIGNQEQYTLLGLGIRTVSFLSIQVYVVGLYIRTQDISALQEKLIHSVNPTASTLIPSEKEELKKSLLDPEKSKEIWAELLNVPGLKTAWRISPTRNTDFAHLRDGWVTGINTRTREAKQIAPSEPSRYESEEFGNSVRNFKGLFAGGKAPKGSVMILARDRQGVMDIMFQAKPDSKGKEVQHLGTVADERIGRLIWLGYLAGQKVSSEAARQGIVHGAVGFAGRPVGSVETMVT